MPNRTSLIHWAARVFIPLGVLAAACVQWAPVATGGDEGSVVPPSTGAPPVAPPIKPQAPRPPSGAVEILTCRAGPGPYAWAVPGRIARTFITDTAEALEVEASAQVKGRPDLAAAIRWEVVPPAGFEVPGTAALRGPKLTLRLERAEGNPTGVGEPLSVTVIARTADPNAPGERSVALAQDLKDRLRQEYVDLTRAYVPGRSELLDEAEFRARYGRKYPSVGFAELNWTRQPGLEERYPFVLASEALVRTLHETRKLYGRPLTVSSAFRNPVHQVAVHAAVSESHHQYGRAADLYVAPDSAPPQTGRKVAEPRDWLRLAASAVRAGGAWIEPMVDCHPNTDRCHVHVDVRDGGPRSAVVRVSGRITDPAGLPAAGATVTLAGMPAVTNAAGDYTLKHVVTPGEYELTAEAPGRAPYRQKVTVSGPELVASMRLPLDPQPFLVARVAEPAAGKPGNGKLRVVLKNEGRGAASALRLAAAAGAPLKVFPASLPALGAGQTTTLTVVLPGGAGMGGAPELNVMFLTPAGKAQAQRLSLAAVSEPATTPAVTARPAAAEPSAVPVVGTIAPRRAVPDAGAAAAGLAAGGAAAAAQALARRRFPAQPARETKGETPPAPVAAPAEPAQPPAEKMAE